MIRFAVLGSGSSGNSYLFSTDRSSVLVDAGFSLKELRRRAALATLDFETVKGLCLTHMHPDHNRGAGVFARKTGMPVHVHGNLVTHSVPEFTALGVPEHLIRTFEPGRPFVAGDFVITAFPTSHDSPHSVGFSLEAEGRCLTVLTDTGTVDDGMRFFIGRSDVLFIEANHDRKMLEEGPYPWMLKRRIAGEKGHLSNADTIGVLNESTLPAEALLYFCHLSRVNNRPEVLATACEHHMTWKGNATICEHGAVYNGCITRGDFVP